MQTHLKPLVATHAATQPRFSPHSIGCARLSRALRIELLEHRLLLAADSGDAADASGFAYPTATHEAVGPMLGVLRDTSQVTYNALATGDAQDEDGVVFGTLRAGQSGFMTVYVTNAPTGARLDAWIDFNRNVSWNDATDQIVDNLPVAAGDNRITFSVPATVTGGHYLARVRLSTSGNLNSTGNALDGEVEDYLIPIANAESALSQVRSQ